MLLPRSTAPLLALLIIACADAPSTDGASTSLADGRPAVVRDSAGITIVENTSPLWADGEGWTLSSEPLFLIPGVSEAHPDGLLDPTSISVDSRGRIIVGDGDQGGRDAILVYDSLGAPLFETAGAGQGPGEFRQLWWSDSYRGDSLVAFDMGGDVVRVFDPEGVYVRQVTLPPTDIVRAPSGTSGYTAGIDMALADGAFVGYPFGATDVASGPGIVWKRHDLLRLDADGSLERNLGSFGIYQEAWDGSATGPYWFGATRQLVADGAGFYYGHGDEWTFHHYDEEGRLDRVVRRAHEPVMVTSAWKEALENWYLELTRAASEGGPQMVEQLREMFTDGSWAAHLPPYSAALVDHEGHLWVENFRWLGGVERSPFDRPTQWSVFDPEGVWLGNVEVPANVILQEVAGDRALGFHVDEFGVHEVRAYALNRR